MHKDIAFGIIIGLIFVSLLVIFCIILVRMYIRKITNYTKVIYQKDIDFQMTLNRTIIETQELVLNNISSDLHDDAGQQLTYINFQVENLKLDSPDLENALEPISDSVRNLSKSIRSISHSLNNQLLLQQDLIKAITAEVERLRSISNMEISLQLPEDSRKVFDPNEKIVIFRMFQEIINNMLKHAQATAVSINISIKPFFTLDISDNGKGFDQHAAQITESFGLMNMKARAAAINFDLLIDSAPGKGTSIKITEKII